MLSTISLFPLPFCVDDVEVPTLEELESLAWTDTSLEQIPLAREHRTIRSTQRLVDQYAVKVGWPTLTVRDCWVNRMLPGTVTHRHRHSNSTVSTITYLHSTDGTEFWRPESAWGMIQPDDSQSNRYTNLTQTLTCQTPGTTIVFPSHVYHQSVASTHTRYSIAANWTFETFGNTKTLNSA